MGFQGEISARFYSRVRTTGRILSRNRFSLIGAVVLSLMIFLALFGRIISPFDPQTVLAGPVFAPPQASFWFGTDDLGRDVLSRTISGIRISLIVGVTASAVAMVIGVAVGALAGFFGRAVDNVLMRITELFMVIPSFFLALVLVAFVGAHLINIIVVIGLLSWPVIARITRSEVLAIKSRQYVDAARVVGASSMALLFGEILPNATAPIIVATTLNVGQAILTESGLSYLGLGDPNAVSLGLMLQQSQLIMVDAPWAAAFPGVFITLAVLSVNLVGDALNDLIDPRAKTR